MKVCTLVQFVLICCAFCEGIPIAEFYELESDKYNMIITDNGTSLPISLNPPLPFYGKNYITCNISADGFLELYNEPRVMGKIEEFPAENYTFIAPFFADFNVQIFGGTIKYSTLQVSKGIALDKAQEQIREFEQYKDFQPKYLVLATWERVAGSSNNNQTNTLQCVLTTDGEMTFAIFLYNELQWSQAEGSAVPARVGFNDGERNISWMMPCSGTDNITLLTNSSNIGENGVWIFRIDQDTIEPACKDKDACEGDILCSCLRTNQQSCICSSNTITDNAAEVFASSTVLGLLLIVSILIMIIS